MKMIDDVIIIGIDSGYGNIKTANCCFPASVSAYAKEPVFKENLLVFEGKFYLIGEGHKEFLADKTKDLDYYTVADCDCKYCLYYGGRKKGEVNCLAEECVCKEELQEALRRERNENGGQNQ